jgi:hypothetical protein
MASQSNDGDPLRMQQYLDMREATGGRPAPQNLSQIGMFGIQGNPELAQAASTGLGQLGTMEDYIDVGSQELRNQQLLAAQGRDAGAGLGGFQQAGMDASGRLSAFGQTGNDALQQQRALSGLSGPDAQAQAISGLENSPRFQAMMKQGEEAILQNASATGGLRGGRTQEALADLRMNLLSQEMQTQEQRMGQLAGQGAGISQYQAGAGQQAASQQYGTGVGQTAALAGQGLNTSQYMTGFGGGLGQFLSGQGAGAVGDIARMGQASAAGQAAAGQQSANQIANLMGQQGSALAGGQIAGASGGVNAFNNLAALGVAGAKAYAGMG